MGTTNCAYVGCISKTGPLGKVSMFRFPVANKRRVEIWLENCDEETSPEFQVLKPTRVYVQKQTKKVLEEPEILVDFGKLKRRHLDDRLERVCQITTETMIEGDVESPTTITEYDMGSMGEGDEEMLSGVEFDSEDEDTDEDPLATESQISDMDDSIVHLADPMAHSTDPMVRVTDVGKVLEPTFVVHKPMSEPNEIRTDCAAGQNSNVKVSELSNIGVNSGLESVPLDTHNKRDVMCPIIYDESRLVDPHIGKISVPTMEPPSNEADHILYDEYINKPWRTRWPNDEIETPLFVYSEQKKPTKVTVFKIADRKLAKSWRSSLNSTAGEPKRKQAEKNVETNVPEKNVETNMPEKNIETNVIEKNVETNVIQKNVETNVPEENVETNIVEKNVDTNVIEKNVETNVIEKNVETIVREKNVETNAIEKNFETNVIQKNVETNVPEKNVETNVTEKNVETNMRNQSIGKPINSKEYWKTKLIQILHSTNFCGVCLSTDDDMNSVYDQFEIVVCERSHAATLADILRVVFTETEDLLANSQICKYCIDKLIKSYMFIKQTRETSRILHSHINDSYKKACYIRNNVLKVSNHEQAMTSKVMIELDSTLIPTYYNKDKIQNNDIKESEDNAECNDNDTDERVENSEVDTEKEINNDVVVIIPEVNAIDVNITDSFANENYDTDDNNAIHGIYSDGLDNCRDDKYRDNNEDDNSKETHVEETEVVNNETELENDEKYKALQDLTCPICHEKFKNRELVAHLRDHFNEHSLRECTRCNVGFYSVKELEEHKQMWHYRGGNKCLTCLESYSEVEMEQHQCRFACGSCAEVPCVHHKYLMCYREQILNGVHRPKCLDCEFRCMYKYILLKHVNISHLKDCPFSCKICNRKFGSKGFLAMHKCRKKVYECRHCGMEFNNRSLYRCHLNEYRIQCDYCPRKFNTPNQLDTHRGNHCRKLKQIPCDVCQRVFPTNSQKKVHMLIRHKIPKKLKECDICHEKFAYRKHLIQHVLLHRSGEKYCCKDCKVEYTNLREYQEHRRIHFGLCELCGKEMEQPLLKKHISKQFCQKNT